MHSLNNIFVAKMLNMYKFFAVFLVCLLISCGNKKTQQLDENEKKPSAFIIQKEDLNNLNYAEFILDRNLRDKLSGWIKYDELEEKINELKVADLSYFKSDKEVVETLIKEFSETLPEKIKTDAIEARVLVVQNMYYKLNSAINLSTSTKEEIKKAITDLFEAFSNLNYQINKKFEKDSQNTIKP